MKTLATLLILVLLPFSVSVGCDGTTTDTTIRLPELDDEVFQAYIAVTQDSIFYIKCCSLVSNISFDKENIKHAEWVEQCDTLWRIPKAPPKVRIMLDSLQWQKLMRILEEVNHE